MLYVPLAEVDIGLLANNVGVAATHTLDLGQGVHDLPLAINVGVEQTKMVSAHSTNLPKVHTEECERTAARGRAARETW